MSNRRSFLKNIFAGTIFTAIGGNKSFSAHVKNIKKNKYIIDNPYEEVDWEKFKQITSTSHTHITAQDKLDKMYRAFNLRHFPISNYYPSVPYYPANKIKANQYMVRQDFGTIYDPLNTPKDRWRNGKFLEGPLEWNKIIMDPKTGWYDKLPEDKKNKMPFTVGGSIFTNIPDDIIFSPNAEHHSFTNTGLHANALGSLFCSGTFDARNEYLTTDHGYCYGTGLPWETAFRKMTDQLLFADAGGITINHPTWSNLKYEDVCNMLDFDNRVLGIEVYNDGAATGYGDPNRGWALKLWDQLLTSGRKCLGFFVPDHSVGGGKNILLVPEFKEYECLKAYRKGAFYGTIKGNGLEFTNIMVKNHKLIIETNKSATIRLASDKGQLLKQSGNNKFEYEIPLNNGKPGIKYIRIEAWDEFSDLIFSQPIRFPEVLS